jgi:Transglutaminase-like superfamily
VQAVLSRTAPTCLERALVAQRWLAAHGDPREVIIGVITDGKSDIALASGGFAAHAWLEGEQQDIHEPYLEMHRIPAP